jgi:anti-anti-sigma factor
MDADSDKLDRRLKELITNGVRKLLLNLTGLTQVDSSGVAVIIKVYVCLRDYGGELKLLCPCGRVLEVLTLFRLPGIISSFDDESQALASFRFERSYAANR